jgi:DNA replication protein DnaC
MSEAKTALEAASIKQSCKRLHMPTIASQCVRLAEQAIKEKQNHLTYLDALLEAEVEERERNVVARRLKDAHFPKVKTLEEFDFETACEISSARLRKLSEGEYITRIEPVLLLGETDPATFCTSLLRY